ncbi:hypothetical protein ARALYDRAFT_483730 [Arabidopsis lyrata subsp. lyrata]|uniref:DUF4378 domain-containing protein n=1 Tax=Arabidopsis lyrata subsp. lyrata TaxID=81972 RepID=D7LDA1_ARALL|nr:hypothetical protein ARALYDRAFT_483730 [Arabidopsis lyrata subsp. lyrata]
MEKEICRRHLSREGIGCVWVFMSMFDFRHGGSNQKLLMDKKRGSKRIIGNNGMFDTKVEKQLTCDCDYDCEESEADMQSVKKLIEDEIDEKTKQKCEARNRKRRSRTCSKISEDINVLIVGDDDDHAEKADDQCPRISQNEVDLVPDDSEEKFSELIKRCKKNLDDAFQVLDSKEESFLNIGTPISRDSQRINELTQCRHTIVILKPEPNSLDVGSSPGTPSTDNKTKNGRFSSRFILSRIRRRLKFAVGKNPCNAQHDSDPDPDALSSNMSQNCCLGEAIETNPGKGVSDGETLPDIASKREANKEDTIHESEDSKKNMCGIYIAAKKHLSEMLAEGDDADSPDKEVPRILGKILSPPEFSTPDNSPRVNLALDHQLIDKPKIQQCSSEGYYYEETEFMPVPEDTGMEEEEKTVLDSLSEVISSSIIQQDAYVDEDEQKQLLEKEVVDEGRLPCSPPNSSVRMSECQENTTDVLGKSSPVSVLEPLFTDDDTSPNSSRFSSAEVRMQPLCIRFDEADSPRPEKDNDAKTRMDDKELALEYIQAVVKSSELNWEELLARSFYSEKILEQALMDDIDFCSTNLCSDKKLLFDCINEVLMEFCGHGPWISFVKPSIRFFPDMENAVEVVQEEVYWHLLPLPSPHTLDQIVQKDLARTGNWMDLRFDIGCIGSETGEIILDELLEEIISNCTDLVQPETINKVIH